MTQFKFQNQVDTIINWYNQGKSYTEIARLLHSDNVDRDAQNVRRLLRKHLGDIHGHPKAVITDSMKEKIQYYLDMGKTPKYISDTLNINYSTLGWYLNHLGLRFRPNPGNINYFKVIDTYAKAYILGFIAADGALVPTKTRLTITLTITVKYEDREVLEFIKSEIGNTHNIIDIQRPSSFDATKMIHHARLAFSTPELVKDIMKYGITPRKSLNMDNIIDNIPYKFRDAFIIGYFDGDGAVSTVDGVHPNSKGIPCESHLLYISIRGTDAFLKGICSHLNIPEQRIHKYDSISTLSFANKKYTYRLFRCYEHLPFYYKRKYDRFLSRINRPAYDKYKQVQTISSPTDNL